MLTQYLKFTVITLLCVASFKLFAADNQPVATQEDKAEERIDEGLKKFGYLTGLALGCVDAKHTVDLEREAMNVNAEISRNLGIDRAFLYTAAFGYGSNIELKIDECKEVIQSYESRIETFRKGALR
ncbi:MAG: hypothetical protein ACRC6P_16865 [Shewanella oncorhynchi]